MTHTEESLMALVWDAVGGVPVCAADEEPWKPLRLAIRGVLAERDSCAQMVISAERQRDKQARRAEKAEAENLQRGNVIGRISAHLLGNKNNVTDEDVVIAAAEVGRELQGARERIERLQALVAPHEPVAWMVYTQDGKSVFVTDNPTDIPPNCTALPLFTESKA